MLQSARRIFAENQILIVLVGLLAGVFIPDAFRVFHPYNTILLQLIFFLSALRIDMGELAKYAKDWKMHLLTGLFMLVVLPIAVFYPISWFAPEWALPFMLITAMPTGMTIALIADFFGGKTSLAIIIVLTTSVLAPFTIPAVSKLLVGRSVPIDATSMLWSLVEAIILPFFVAWIFRRVAPQVAKKGDTIWRTVSVIAFGVLIASIVSKTAGGTTAVKNLIDISGETALILLFAFIYIGGLIYASYRMVSWRTVSERITIALCMLYLNFTLSLYVADEFFAEQMIVPKMVLILLVLNAMLPFFKMFASRVVKLSKQKTA